MTFWSGVLVWISLILMLSGIALIVDATLDGPEALPAGWWVPIIVLVAMLMVAVVMLA